MEVRNERTMGFGEEVVGRNQAEGHPIPETSVRDLLRRPELGDAGEGPLVKSYVGVDRRDTRGLDLLT